VALSGSASASCRYFTARMWFFEFMTKAHRCGDFSIRLVFPGVRFFSGACVSLRSEPKASRHSKVASECHGLRFAVNGSRVLVVEARARCHD
jgi:hypothetical protein